VPACESSPTEAALTNISGAENIVRAIKATGRCIRAVACSTDKACLPSCVMGMTKAIQERIFLHAGFNVCRFGNVPGSRGSVIPLWKEQIARGEAITLTDGEMTRFLLPVRRAVDVMVFAAMSGEPGETFVPVMKACAMSLLAKVACSYLGGSGIAVLGPRPGEKKHEAIISREESLHAATIGLEYYAIGPNSLSSDAWEYRSDNEFGMITEANTLELMLRNEGVL
jgi:FlaA1/EpsC-like NDP-sugar epimerase